MKHHPYRQAWYAPKHQRAYTYKEAAIVGAGMALLVFGGLAAGVATAGKFLWAFLP